MANSADRQASSIGHSSATTRARKSRRRLQHHYRSHHPNRVVHQTMSLSETRKQNRERVRKHRGVTTLQRACQKCQAILSIYAEEHETLCAVCFSEHATHEEYVMMEELRESGLFRHPDYCKNGHNLNIHGKMIDKGDGKESRRCTECRRINQAAYQRRRRTRQT